MMREEVTVALRDSSPRAFYQVTFLSRAALSSILGSFSFSLSPSSPPLARGAEPCDAALVAGCVRVRSRGPQAELA